MSNTVRGNEGTLFDRIAVGLFSALLAIVTALIIPLMFFLVGGFVPFPRVYLYGSIAFAFIMFAIGFLLKLNILENIYGNIWTVLYKLIVGEIPK
jgi:fumarate reductase subunit D